MIKTCFIYLDLSVLVIQQSLSAETYNFWRELKDKVNRGGIFDEPPYNLISNLSMQSGNIKVNGYFSVVSEQAKRWYFNADDLSYRVNNNLLYACETPPWPPAKCINCLQYSGEDAVNQPPS